MPKPRQSADRPSRVQRHLDRRRDRSGAAEIPRPHSRAARQLRGGRRADGARLRRQERCPRATPARPTCCAPSAARRTKSGTSTDPAKPALVTRIVDGLEGHAQELVGVRHRHRLPRLRRGGLARAAHDRGLRSQRSGQAGEDPRLRPGRPAARRDRRGADRAARRRSRPGRRATASISAYGTNKGGVLQIVDREKLLNGPKEPTPDNLRYPRDRPARHAAAQRRAHRLPDAARCRSRSSPRTRTARSATS